MTLKGFSYVCYLQNLSSFYLVSAFPNCHHRKRCLTFCRYIGPLREEAASWAEKLKEVSEVLEQWLEVQDLWQYLEAVFSNAEAAKVKTALERSNEIVKSIQKYLSEKSCKKIQLQLISIS